MLFRTPFSTRTLILAGASLLAALLLTQTSLFEKLDLQMGDVQASLLAPRLDLSGIVLVDVDEESMNRLESELGAWPYDRSVYDSVLRFLEGAGARSVTFDIVLAEGRRGDDDLAEALKSFNNVVLAALAFDDALDRGPKYAEQLARIAWRAPDGVPAVDWKDMTLPLEAFSGGTRGRAGVGLIRVKADSDGVLRRAPLLHRAYGRVLPSLALATLFAGAPAPQVRWSRQPLMLHVGDRSWPVDAQGQVVLRYPRNVNDILPLPFKDVLHAALGMNDVSATTVAAAIRGKRVFVGSSTAVLGDYVYTPYGNSAGLMALGLTTQLLEHNEVMRPQQTWINALLVLVAILIPVASLRERLEMRPLASVAILAVTLATVLACTSVLVLLRQSVSLLLPVTAGFIAFSLLLLLRLFLLYQDRQRLSYEKMAAEQAYQLKSQFISQMTHELRTPLTAIMGFNRLLAEGGLSQGTRERYTHVVDKNSHHLITIINNMLDQSKIEAGQMKINRAPTSVREVVEDVALTLSKIAAEKGLALKTEYGGEVPNTLELDAFRLRQILVNLAGNAIKFTRQGEVCMLVSWRDGSLQVDVSDTGSGMSQDTMARIFTPFQQGSDDTQQNFGGTGLGLAISRNLCNLMNGSLGVRSRLGEGSTFTVRLPAPRSEDRPARVEPATVVPLEARKLTGRVLLADDNSDIRDLVSRYLKIMGLTVLTAEDGGQAVEVALREQPDIMLMDIEMPVLNGFEVIRRLRAAGFRRPVLALTAHPEGPEIERAMAEGCDDFVAKPVNRDRLYAVLRDLLEREGARPDQAVAAGGG